MPDPIGPSDALEPDPIGPYDALEPEPRRPPPSPAANEPGARAAFGRGLMRRCPRCGSGGLFEGWFSIRDRCPRCRLRLQREEGGFLGAKTIWAAVDFLVYRSTPDYARDAAERSEGNGGRL